MSQITRNVFVTIQKRSMTADTQGQPIETWANIHVAVPARQDEPRGKTRATKDSILYQADYILFLDRRYDYLDEGEYQVVIGNSTYKILSVNNPGGQGTHTELLLQRTK